MTAQATTQTEAKAPPPGKVACAPARTRSDKIFHTKNCSSYPSDPTFVDEDALDDDWQKCSRCSGDVRKNGAGKGLYMSLQAMDADEVP